MQLIDSNNITTLCFFDCHATLLSSEIATCRTAVGAETDVLRRLGDFGRYLSTRSTPPNRAIVLQTNTGWSCYIDNDRIGGIPRSLMTSIAERLRIRAIGLVMMDQVECNKLNRPFSMGFAYEDGRSGCVISRSVMVTKDIGNWSFDTDGAPIPEEVTEAYLRKRTADRLGPTELETLLIQMGITSSLPIKLYDDEWFELSWRWQASGDSKETSHFLTRLWELAKRS